ncbi:hypothetical protein HYALB_00001606 [Hymenoscyphus albidus]|uniref:Sulfotransferase family protein n=1 Tax=Hymenoscyphus albidus TaxID=595503 RepID=A0A9N9LBM6_9HELO|nr:hypothetical protein HYALB_00001606 [Hymenoscyphus albidus]
MPFDKEVDKISAIEPRPVEMQVLYLGLSRTGTMTMQTALNKLGYRSYHFTEAVKPDNRKFRHINCWAEALKRKATGIGKPYEPADFDKLLQE